MSAESTLTVPEAPTTTASPTATATVVRLWPAVVFVCVYWGVSLIVRSLEKPYFFAFLYNLGSSFLLTLVYFGWWWFNRRIPLRDRVLGFLLLVGGAMIAEPFYHESIGWWGVLMQVAPVVLTVWTAWLVVVQKAGVSWRRTGSVFVVAAALGYFALVRLDGLDGDLHADANWRWRPSAEQMFLSEKTQQANPEASVLREWRPTIEPTDWTDYRGKERDGVVRGTNIATDWKTAPPRLAWRQRVGPAWSGVIVVADRLFTQEQRGEKEAVVCYDAGMGKEVWVHEDAGRFWESVSGAGPRATPTFADGMIFTLGAKGVLNCLVAGTGKLIWQRNIAQDAGAKPPQWGYSSSPLVMAGRVVVFAGGDSDKSLLGYEVKTGKPAWTAPAGKTSYSSPQAVTLGGKRLCLMLGDHGLVAVDPATGAVAWTTGTVWEGAPRTVQPHMVGKTQILVSTLEGTGVTLLDASETTPAALWTSKNLKPEFPDFVVHAGCAFGFDGGVFGCIELENGNRCWKKGRYGRGQVVLLADQSLLLVVTEKGEVVLLPADPQRHEELGRFQAVEGKTWNHPVVVRGRLYLRNAEEMACYELPVQSR